MNLPRVTDIIKSAGLMDTTHFTQFARDRGTAVHLATALYDEGDLDTDSLDPELVPYLESYKKWKAESRAEIVEIELEVIHDTLGYVGHLDRIIKLNHLPWVLDLKCGPRADWHGVQTEAYRQALGEQKHQRAGLYLNSDGSRANFREHLDLADWSDFKAALQLFRRRQRCNLL